MGARLTPSPVSQSKAKNVKLPTLEIQPFYGSYKTWLEFRDAFQANVESDEDLTPSQKFYYLKSFLKGAASDVIQSIEVCDENYNEAWELLKYSFENKKLIGLSHIDSLYNFLPLIKESYTGLKKLLDETRKSIRVLKTLKQPVETWDVLLIYILEKKLDVNTKQEWKRQCKLDSFQTMDEFLKFLARKCQYLYTSDTREIKHSDREVTQKGQLSKYSTSKVFVAANQSCPVCKESHYIFQCKTFIESPLHSKRDEIKKLKLCWNCLRHGHAVQNCLSKGCKYCGKKHNSLLHVDYQQQIASSSQNSGSDETDKNSFEARVNTQTVASVCQNESSSLTTHVKVNSEILLSTALVLINDKFGKYHECRALLDSGSQSNFITKNLCEKLQLATQKIDLPISGINQITTSVTQITNATIKSWFNGFNISSSFLVLNKITDNLPVTTVNTVKLNIPEQLNLADTTFNKSQRIDLLLGATIFWDLLCIGQVKLGKYLPIMQKTKLGWVISGTIPLSQPVSGPAKAKNVCNFITGISLEDQLERFWRVEECHQEVKRSKEEIECEKNFVRTTERNENGRFIVSLPLRDNLSELGNSYDTVLKRLHACERKLKKNEELSKQYTDFLTEYENLGHMTKIEARDINQSSCQGKIIYYLPHHGVSKETSQTTKLRVVFDASAETNTGVSLNNKLKVGPKIQDDLFNILIRFRKHNYVIVGDVAKMYRQVLVKEEHRDLQRILWRATSNDPVDRYRLNTVTYGTAPASFLAVRCLHQVGRDNQEQFPEASKAIIKDFYVDDVLTGSESIESARRLRRELTMVLGTVGFPLRKWLSNDSQVLEDLIDKRHHIEHFISDDKVTKTLGLLWNSEMDTLQYRVNLDGARCKVTKRTILSVISQIFDPLGLVRPTVVKAKIIMQKLWQLQFSWDEAVPLELHTSWVQFLDQINLINTTIVIPRHILYTEPTEIQLHGFCDASIAAYGACIFIRSTDSDSNSYVHLVCAKSRVSPLKTISLPRLELCGALLLARLAKEVLSTIDLNINKCYYWCDSTIVLSWLSGEISHWKTFVANRVTEINQLTEGHQWRHVVSKDNPADIISRGMDPVHLANCKLWWDGPSWLKEDEQFWAKSIYVKPSNIPEQKKLTQVFISHVSTDIFNKFSSLTRLQRVVAFCLRFKKNATTHRANKLSDYLSVQELSDSLMSLIRLAQSQEFASEIQSLSRFKNVHKSSKLVSLNPFLDDNGLIRVGGRLRKADISYDQKHQIILSKDHKLTKLIILHEHYKNLHAGPQAVLSTVRLRFWIPSGRSTVRQILHKCITCFRNQPTDYKLLMGDLPKARITPTRPFTNCGVDYAGPFDTKVGKIRSNKINKSYLCIFVCFVTKAVHLELVSDLTTDSFLNCLKRFIARRGICKHIYSDNGTNFVGASNSLKELFCFIKNPQNQVKYSNYLTQMSITWHFIPPRSPHFGGLWESAVKSAKFHLKRVIGNTILTYEELHTLVTQIESCLNSRPLTPLSENSDDLNALTPGHFLIGTPFTALPQEDLTDHNPNRLKRYHHLTQMIQHFWARWSKDYLLSLQPRGKWRSKGDIIRPGMMVLLKDENLPPMKWQLGRIIDLQPGDDKVCRVVSVKTSTGVYKRALTKLCILPIETTEDIN